MPSFSQNRRNDVPEALAVDHVGAVFVPVQTTQNHSQDDFFAREIYPPLRSPSRQEQEI